MWELVQSYPQLEAPRRTRLAGVRPQVTDKTDLSGFFEAVCQNRCYNAKVFQPARLRGVVQSDWQHAGET